MQAVVTPDGLFRCGRDVFRCAVERGGVRADKREGDGATPAGGLPLRRVLYRADRVAVPSCRLPTEPLSPTDGWCDDPIHGDYNRAVRLPHPARHEVLWRTDHLYDVIAVLEWNDAPVERGRGSAIFLHLARPDYAPTEGCVALAAADLRAVLAAGLSTVLVATGP